MKELKKIAIWRFNNAIAIDEEQKKYSSQKVLELIKKAEEQGAHSEEIKEALEIGNSKDFNKVLDYVR